jgi:cell division GTPase FtsZ
MAKLYIFGIGGTGSRVLRSLTMLMASGVKMNSEVIVPIIIDPDVAAADMTRTVELMRLYSEIRSRLNHSGNSVDGFYATEIKELVDSFRMELENTQNIRFDSYIGLSSMDDSNKALTKMLFSEDNLRSSMEVGFKGNPNIGSVVLNRFSQSDQFREFADSFEENDKIFIISSIFGGTGASGFPVLLKNIRTLHSSQTNLPQSANIENSVVGAITLLPYFGIKADPQSSID